MNGLRIGVAATALLIAAGCGGGSGGDHSKSGAATSAAPKLIELADACVLVNKAAQDSLGEVGLAQSGPLNSFAAALDEIAQKTDDRGRDAVEDLATRSREVSETLATATKATDRLDAGLDMLRGYKLMQDSCRAVGSPLSVPN